MNKNKAEINFTNNLQIVSSVITGGGKYCSNSIYNYVPKFNESFTITPFSDQISVTLGGGMVYKKIELDKDLTNAHELICPFISFSLPQINKKKEYDCIKYCDLPGLYLIKKMKLAIEGLEIETLDTHALIAANKLFLRDNYDYFCKNHFGGINGCYQKVQKGNTEADQVLMPSIPILFAAAFEIFRSEELFPKNLAGKVNMVIGIEFNKIDTILQHTSASTYNDVSTINADIYLASGYLNPGVFNNNPLTNPSLQKAMYCFHSTNMLPQTFGMIDLSTFKFNLQKNPTTEYALKITNASFISNTFLGSTNEECRKNYWLSLLQRKSTCKKESLVVQLNQKLQKGEFYKFKEDLINPYSLECINETTLKLKFKGVLKSLETIITSSLPFSLFPDDMCINFNVFDPKIFHLKPEVFKSVHFQIEKYDEESTSYFSSNSVYDGFMTLLNGDGIFSFTGKDGIQYAFLDINNMKKNNSFSDEYYEIVPCLSVENIIQNNLILPYKMWKINLPEHVFYDLDKKIPIEVESYQMTTTATSGTKLTKKSEMELERGVFLNKNQKYLFGDYQINRKIELIKNEMSANGFNSFGNGEAISFTLKDFAPKSSIALKEFSISLLNIKITVYTLQFLFHIFSLMPHSKIATVKEFSIEDAHNCVKMIIDGDKMGDNVFSSFKLLPKTEDKESFEALMNMESINNSRHYKMNEHQDDDDGGDERYFLAAKQPRFN